MTVSREDPFVGRARRWLKAGPVANEGMLMLEAGARSAPASSTDRTTDHIAPEIAPSESATTGGSHDGVPAPPSG